MAQNNMEQKKKEPRIFICLCYLEQLCYNESGTLFYSQRQRAALNQGNLITAEAKRTSVWDLL